MFSNSDLMDLRFSPFEGSCVAIVAFDEFIDRIAQLGNTGKVGSSQGLTAQDTKPNLNLIEPGGVGWSENENAHWGELSTNDPLLACGWKDYPKPHGGPSRDVRPGLGS